MDFQNLRLPESHGLSKPLTERTRQSRYPKIPFLKGPVPLDWLQRAMELGIGALSVGIVLWYFRGLKKSKVFKVGIGDIADLMTRSWRTAHRGLNALERQELISLERHPGRKHLVTI